MAALTVPWPVDLPDCLESWQETERESITRTNMDAGPPKVRRRFTAPMREMRCTMVLRADQYETFRDFFDIELAQGINWHTFRHPYTGNVESFRFVSPFEISNMNALAITVSMLWEQLPYAA